MTVEQATCELMERNIDDLNYLVCNVNRKYKLEIYFVCDYRNVVLCRNDFDYEKLEIKVSTIYDKVVFRDRLSNYGPDFESQKRFILNVLNNLPIYYKKCGDLIDEKIHIDNSDCIEILGKGDAYEEICIDIEPEILKLFEFENRGGYIGTKYQNFINFLKFETKMNWDTKIDLDENKIKIVYSKSKNKIFISRVMKKFSLDIYHINNSKMKDCITKLLNVRSLEGVVNISHRTTPICYSQTTDKELKKVAEFIKKLIMEF